MNRSPEKQSLITLILLTLVTFGIYYLIWFYNTKEDINGIGGKIPTFFLYFIPLLNIYFLYCFAHEFVHCVRKEDNAALVFLHFGCSFVPFIYMLVVQYQINELIDKEQWI
jgi:hypothetical protein